MPKDEFDFEDPLELNGIAFLTEEDTTGEMAECFIEEFMRLGCNHKQVLALFRNPYYIGMNMVLEKRGESFVRDCISEIFARWGRSCTWPDPPGSRGDETQTSIPNSEFRFPSSDQSRRMSTATVNPDDKSTDPMGGSAPKTNL